MITMTTELLKFHYVMLTLLLVILEHFVISQALKPEIKSMHITSDIYFRFATTVVEAKILNINPVASEVLFDMTLPDAAFITAFTMEIGGRRYAGDVKEKEKAKQQFEEAKSRGESAGHIAAAPRTSNKFNILVNIQKNALVVFKLKYQELLRRTLGSYHHVIYVDSGQPIEDFRIKVLISESRDIVNLSVPPLEGNTEIDISKFVNIKRISPLRYDIRYSPSLEEQKAMSEQGISGQFKVKYDVSRDKDAGDILIVNGYFVHLFAPKDLEPLPKDVMFVLDRSGSMSGRKIEQLKNAMAVILSDMKPEDRLNILFFDNRFDWLADNTMLEGSLVNFDKAKRFMKAITARGSTDINKAVIDGIKLLTRFLNTKKSSIVMFLTDGLPTSGETSINAILRNVRTTNEAKLPIFSLGFGNNVNLNFLKQMSTQNNGFARKIYVDSDAALQIEGLYSEISSALLKNVTFDYLGDVDYNTITKFYFPFYFGGSELIVAGRLRSKNSKIVPRVRGWNDGYIDLIWRPRPVPDLVALTTDADFSTITENMWAYLTIKQLIRELEGDITSTDKDRIKAKIIDIALKYQFVTPFTSMVVTAPNLRRPVPHKRRLVPRPGLPMPRPGLPMPLSRLAGSFGPSFSSSSGNGRGRGGQIVPHGIMAPPIKKLRLTTTIPTTTTTATFLCNFKERASPDIFIYMKGSKRPLCMDMNFRAGKYLLLADKEKSLAVTFNVCTTPGNRKNTIGYIEEVVIKNGQNEVKLNSEGTQAKKWSKIGYRYSNTFSSQNITFNILPSRDGKSLQIDVKVGQSNVVGAKGLLGTFVGIGIERVNSRIVKLNPNLGGVCTSRNITNVRISQSRIDRQCWKIDDLKPTPANSKDLVPTFCKYKSMS
ncbi:inter-alpha-trypsin inhibitor heavy chain H3-like [Mytilus californianus]|uniref:inter-alpha-trypsin inhibitor heavy chain H3-like n=1 Tax=Mytilus californianus TaxID=6549 RepID=UPI002247E323|nr:inter-alpha-trypsin inhibitor heavy chain H3-like [Mytilus californianus]